MTGYNCRKKSGVTTIELAASLPIFIAVTIFSINTAAFIFAADFCDRACKDCARAAGQMSTPDQSVNAMNAAAASHPVDNFLFQQLSPELLVYQDYNNSTSNPTPAYGTTSDSNGENGPDNITPAKDFEEVSPTTTNKTKSSGKNRNRGHGKQANAIRLHKAANITNISAVIADPNQTITPGPFVVVRTTMQMRIPISINFFGLKLFAGNVEDNPQLFQFQSIYTYPITNTYMPL